MSSEKSLAASLWSLLISLGLTGILQVAVLMLGLIAGYYAVRKNKAEAELSEIRLNKLMGAKSEEHKETKACN